MESCFKVIFVLSHTLIQCLGNTDGNPFVPPDKGPCHQNGILITETNQNEDFGVMGIIVDEIEDIVQDFYPGLLSYLPFLKNI